MNKILSLYNIEFKRIYKLYFALIGALFIGNLAGLAISIKNSVEKISTDNKLPMNLSILKSNIGYEFVNTFTVVDIYIYGTIALGIAVIMCLLYALIIWYRDYYSRSKTIYTLLCLPQPRFNIYLSKLITIVVMIYGAIVSQFVFWYLNLTIVKNLAGIQSPIFLNIFKNMMHNVETINIVSANIVEFLMVDIIGVILAIVVIFTSVLIERSIKKVGVMLGLLYIALAIFGYLYLVSLSRLLLINLLHVHIGYYVFLFIVSLFLSHYLMNKKISI
ncbi:hypothetical protein [Paraclostridium sordellii]|uniref:hypothetical protein n=1 Tax=Paraclostridium sordellii TaxID=1505 RepID=UPI0005E9FF36|nr:hypothetical protein [Paeniclostridium sordellii]CEQ17285.1 ABC transporter multidrug-family permease [[Clostridium] sordellii] [Paeniclostridium sordellii]